MAETDRGEARASASSCRCATRPATSRRWSPRSSAACAALAPFEVVYVDDGSTDGDAGRARDAARRPALAARAAPRRVSCGQSAAVRTGVRAARAPDRRHARRRRPERSGLHPALCRRRCEAAGPRTGLAAGQRLRPQGYAASRSCSRASPTACAARSCKDGTRDTGCGLKAFRREVYLALPYFDALHRFMPALVRREGYERRAMSTWSTGRA